MWCRSCQQDVPAVASTDDAVVRCARCHSDLSVMPTDTTADALQAETGQSADHRHVLESEVQYRSLDPPPRSWESWELAEDLREADRLVHSLGIRRVDAAHEIPLNSAALENDPRAQSTARRRDHAAGATKSERKPRRSSLLTWSILSLGLMTFAFGAMLLGWSFWMGRADLWRLGMPFTLAGQAALVIGLVLQLDGLWRSNQAAAESLDELDVQLDELRRATTLLSTSHSSPSQSFYAHMASGAGPRLLLADLKSQLDLLAIKLGEEKQ